MKKYQFIILLLSFLLIFPIGIFSFFSKNDIQHKSLSANEIEDNSLSKKCIKNADHPSNNTGGPDWDLLDVTKTYKICISAFSQNPNSKEVIRSLARIYYKKKEFKKTYQLLLKNTKNKDDYSYYLLGGLFESGEGVDQDLKEAIYYYKIASDNGYALAQHALGELYYKGIGVDKDLTKAFKFYKLAADQGNSRAQFNLGYAYSEGEGVKQDYKEGMKWYKLAAKNGNSWAQINIGYAYSEGEGVKQDYKEGMKWYKLAAKSGNSSAQYNIGYAYSNGQGVKQDYKEALKWYKQSAKNKYTKAIYSVGTAYGYGEGVEQNYREALKWFKLGAEEEHVSSMYAVGFYYENGMGVEKDIDKAENYYNKLINFDKGRAYHGLGRIYLSHPKRKSDEKTGLIYLKDAFENGRYEALKDIFDFYFEKKFELSPSTKFVLKDDIKYLITLLENASLKVEALEVVKEILSEPLYTKHISLIHLNKVIQNLSNIATKKIDSKINDRDANEAAKILSDFYYHEIYVARNLEKFEYYIKLRINRNDYLASGNFGWYQFQEKNNIPLAEKFTINALKINDNYSKIFFYNNLGVFENYKKDKDILKKVNYYKKAVEIIESTDQYDFLDWPYENLARIYLEPSKVQDIKNFKKYVKNASESSALTFVSEFIEQEKIEIIDDKILLDLYELAALKGFSQGYIELSWFNEDRKNHVQALKWALICKLSCDDEGDRDRARTDIIKIKKKLNFHQKSTAEKMAAEWSNGKIDRQKVLAAKYNKQKTLANNFVVNQFGDYYALLIGVKDYLHFENLKTPINDIKKIENILSNKYNFKTETLENPSRTEILKTLNKYTKILQKSDNFILYFAGHGMQRSEEGFWIPANAEKEDDTNWISNNNIVRKLREMRANNILVLADSCFSGLLTRGFSPKENKNETTTLELLNQEKTRIAITSGNNEPVLDGGAGENSIFASVLGYELNKFNAPFTASLLFSKLQDKIVRESVAFGNQQNPVKMAIPKSGHENFDFVFNPQ